MFKKPIDIINVILLVLTVFGYFTKYIDGLTFIILLLLIFLVFLHGMIPWYTKKIDPHSLSVSGDNHNIFYSFSLLFHRHIIYVMVYSMIVFFVFGVIGNAAPEVVSSDTARCIWGETEWESDVTVINDIPDVLKSVKKEELPLAVVFKNDILKAAPLYDILRVVIFDQFSFIYITLGFVMIIVIVVVGLVIFLAEIIFTITVTQSKNQA